MVDPPFCLFFFFFGFFNSSIQTSLKKGNSWRDAGCILTL